MSDFILTEVILWYY